MKAVHKIVAGLAVAGLAVTAALAARPIPHRVNKVASEGGVAGVASAGGGWTYNTSFEVGEGFPAAPTYICNAGCAPVGCNSVAFPCWGHTTGAGFSTITPTIDDSAPVTGTQNLRLTFDLTTRTNIPGFGLGVDARYPISAQVDGHADAPNTVSVEMRIDTPFGQDFIVQPQSNSMGSSQTIALFLYTGAIYIVDDVCETIGAAFLPTGVFWDTTGGYQNYTVAQNPCNNTVHHEYAGITLMDSCIWNGTRLDQFLIYGDNYPGSIMTIDDLSLFSEAGPCPAVCGDNFTEGLEVCDGTDDAACPGRCTVDCTCDPICTQAAPCLLANGANGPYMSSSGYYSYSGGSPFISVDSCGSDHDSLVDIGGLASNDDCNTGPYGAGNDPSASCWHEFVGFNPDYVVQSCACAPNPGGPLLITALHYTGATPAVGSTTIINVRKKATCGGPSVGSCCDTNGPDSGCTNNVLAADCVGADKVWTDQGKCDETCVCIPDCTGLVCGSDGCTGSCGPCDDGDVCNGVEICTGTACTPGTPLDCDDHLACTTDSCDRLLGCGHVAVDCNDGNACTDDGCVEPGGCFHNAHNCDDGVFCNGAETCVAPGGCVGGAAPTCDDGVDCTADSCDTATDACVNDDADCSIPTVSEWGLVVLTLMLLIGAKVYFGRRQAIA